MLTGYPEAADKAKTLGAQGVLLKPFDKKLFTEQVNRLLRADAARAPSGS